VDAIAGGGGLLTVPALLWAGLPPQLALGTNKLQSSCGTALATWRYREAGLLDLPKLGGTALTTFLAALAGAFAVNRINPAFLQQLVPVLLFLIAILLAVRRDFGMKAGRPRVKPVIFGLLFGILLGGYDGFFGPGTGTFWTIACISLLGLDFQKATGYTKVMNLASNLAALLIFAYYRRIDWTAGVAMAGGQLVGARLGAGLVVRQGSRVIRPIFLAVVLLLAGRLAWKAYEGGDHQHSAPTVPGSEAAPKSPG
jgi:uncharacterized membrane protein YfcA